jgi:hypothetical protein
MIVKNLVGLLKCFQEHLPVVVITKGIVLGKIEGVRWESSITDNGPPVIIIDCRETDIPMPDIKKEDPYEGLYSSPLMMPEKKNLPCGCKGICVMSHIKEG